MKFSPKKVEELVRKNVGAVIKEVRETGELANLLTQSTYRSLDQEEWKKVKTQMLDICRSVPALAIFALPGGTLLLPILLKFLPFDLRPTSFKELDEDSVNEESIKKSPELSSGDKKQIDESAGSE